MSELTPMMRQYLEIKKEHQDSILFFRLGDFYEMFFDDAREASKILGLVLTHRAGNPMCGIPYHASSSYIKRLIDAGRKVAICEQTEAPTKGKALVDRQVVQIISPGTLFDESMLDAGRQNYVVSVCSESKGISCAFSDITTGEFSIVHYRQPNADQQALCLLSRLSPSEILIQESLFYENEEVRFFCEQTKAMISKFPHWYFNSQDAHDLLCEHFGSVSLKQFGITSDERALSAAGVLLSYFQENAKQQLPQIRSVGMFDNDQVVHIDDSAQKNLELLVNMQDGSDRNTLFRLLKFTQTAAGTRLLRTWITTPLFSAEKIEQRLEYVTLLYKDSMLLNSVRSILSEVLDLQRLTTRILLDRHNPRDLLAVRQTIDSLLGLIALERLRPLVSQSTLSETMIERVREVSDTIASAIRPELPGQFDEGQVIVDGFDQQLDEYRSFRDEGLGYLSSYAESIKRETGITNLKLKSNKIIGFFLEVSKSQTHLVPDYFHRKQTLTTGERYTTDRLIELEREITEARANSHEREFEIYRQVSEQVIRIDEALKALSDCAANIDCLQSLAYCAIRYGYTRPEICSDHRIDIRQGRHPVVESLLQPGQFIPNDVLLDTNEQSASLITGPNMSGKSTYLRQTALIVLLAHIGSYVPAASAHIGLTDKIFCRVGASDNLARGESTFLVEMHETAYILRAATERSLVIMDEVGRGTSTRDGQSIAYAVLNRLLEQRAKTLFATHYHELTHMEHPMLEKLYLDTREEDGTIHFLKKIRKGSASSSYGIHAASLAGMPEDVLSVAVEYQSTVAEHLQLPLFDSRQYSRPGPEKSSGELPPAVAEIVELLRETDLDTLRPLDALALLDRMKRSISQS